MIFRSLRVNHCSIFVRRDSLLAHIRGRISVFLFTHLVFSAPGKVSKKTIAQRINLNIDFLIFIADKFCRALAFAHSSHLDREA